MTKTHEIIPITDGYVVVDKEVKDYDQRGSWIYMNKYIGGTCVMSSGQIQLNDGQGVHTLYKKDGDYEKLHKIIASIGIKIEGIPLIEEVDEVEQLAFKELGITFIGDKDKQTFNEVQVFKAGYKANTKQYSEEDLRKAFKAGEKYASGTDDFPMAGNTFKYLNEDDYIKSLQKVPISVELGYEMIPDLSNVVYNGSETNYGAVIERLKVNPDNTITPKSINYE